LLILGIDCATWTASVGVVGDHEVLAESTRRVSGSHAAHLLELIENALGTCARRLAEVDLIAVSLGPGSFTGLRICLSTAKGLAMATGAELVGVSTLEALAMVAAPRGGRICPVLDARKGEVYAAVFAAAAGRVTRLQADRALTPRELAASLPGTCTLVGDGVDAYRQLWSELLPDAVLIPFDEMFPSGAAVARLGEESLRHAGASDAGRLEPRYCRKAEAEIQSGR
jgi:tRNA threonylcarbamoyladenosine biosynthesis protein TsaB